MEPEPSFSGVPEWRLKETQRHKETEVQNDQIMSPPNEMMAKEPEDVLIVAPQVQVPQEPSRHPPKSLAEGCVEAVETMPGRNPPHPAASDRCSESSAMRMPAGPGMSSDISLLGCG